MLVIEKFLTALPYELVYSPENYNGVPLFKIRDKTDYMILHTAIIADVDILITGDADFKETDIDHPEILTPKEFHDKYLI